MAELAAVVSAQGVEAAVRPPLAGGPGRRQVSWKLGDGPIDVGDTRFLSADWRGGRLVATQTVGEKADGLAHARWYEFGTAGKNPALKNWGDVRPGRAGGRRDRR